MSQIDLTSSCVCQYRMNDNAASTDVIDSVGAYTGTAQANTNTLDTTGKINGALTFNGTGDYVDIGATFQSILWDSFSVNLWLKIVFTAPPSTGLVVSSNFESSSTSVFMFGFDTTGGNLFLFYSYRANGHTAFNGFYPVTLPTDEYIMATVVLEKLSSTSVILSMYKNGNLVAQETNLDCPMSQYVSAENMFLGKTLSGSLDDVMLFDKALSADEIGFLYNSGSGTEELTGEFDDAKTKNYQKHEKGFCI
jgi:hypothetical protein